MFSSLRFMTLLAVVAGPSLASAAQCAGASFQGTNRVVCNCSPLAAFRSGGWGTWRWGQDGAEAGEWALSGDAAGRDNGAEIGVGFRAPA